MKVFSDAPPPVHSFGGRSESLAWIDVPLNNSADAEKTYTSKDDNSDYLVPLFGPHGVVNDHDYATQNDGTNDEKSDDPKDGAKNGPHSFRPNLTKNDPCRDNEKNNNSNPHTGFVNGVKSF